MLATHNHESTYGSFPHGGPLNGTFAEPTTGNRYGSVAVPYQWVAGNQAGPGNQNACYGPPWTFHILAWMEESAASQRVSETIQARDYEEGCPWDNCDGLPVDLGNRRPESDIQTIMRKYMRCPSAEQSNVMYADLSTENLLKGNYVGSWGGGSFLDGTPNGNRALSGVFAVVPITAKFPIGERMALGKGTRFSDVVDGTSNTVMYSEILSFNQAISGPTSSMPFGSNRDVRGAQLIPMAGGSVFMTNYPPNSPGTDQMPSCEDTAIPATSPMRCRRTGNTNYDGLYWAAARSAHPGGVNAAMADGSVRFIKNSINRTTWSALGSKAGSEVISSDSY